MDTTALNVPTDSIKVYKYRWVILTLYCLYSAINFMQFLQYAIIANVVVKYYEVDHFLVHLTGLVFMISYLILFVPVSHLIERYNLKMVAVLGSGLTAAGNLLKLVSVDRDRFAVVLVSQLLCGMGQVFIVSIPTKVASTWFGPEEVSTACAIAVLGTQLGVAIGCISGPNIVHNSDNPEEIGNDIQTMVTYNAVVTTAIFVLVAIFFRDKPKLPPSQSQIPLVELKDEKPSTLQVLKSLISNKNYLLCCGIFGVVNGCWSSFGIYFNNLYLDYFPGAETIIGWIAFAAVISGGCVGSVVFGYLLDKTHKFKLISFVAIFASAVTLIFSVYAMQTHAKTATYFTIPLFGFFIASTLVLSFEYAAEITYPLPGAVSCGVLNAVVFVCSIVITLSAEFLFTTIGYLWTVIIVIVILFICSVGICFVRPDLKRREANTMRIS